jgi:hypothetical protein
MSILDSFVFLLKADSKAAVEGIENTGEAFDDLKRKGKKTTDEVEHNFNQFGHRLNSIAEGIGTKLGNSISGGIATLGASLGLAAVAGLGLNTALEHMGELYSRIQDAATVGVDVSQYDALSKTFVTGGADAEGFRDSMIDLNESLGEAASDATSGKAKAFQQFGVAVKDAKGNIRGADEVLLDLAGSMEKMSKQEATFQIKQLGITDNKIIQTLLLGNKALKEQIEIQKQKYVLNEKDAEQIKEYTQAQNLLKVTIGGIVDQFTAWLAPALTKVTNLTRESIDWIMEHKRVIAIAAGVIGTVMIPTILRATAATASWAAATLIAMAPYIAIAVAVAALVLVIDDLVSYYQGGGSVIGDFAKKHEMLKDTLDGLGEAFRGFRDWLVTLWNDPEKAIEQFQDFLAKIWQNMVADAQKGIDAMLDGVVNGFTDLSAKGKTILTELWQWVKNLFANLGDEIADSVKGAWDKVKQNANPLTWFDDDDKSGKPATNSPGGPTMAVPGDSVLTRPMAADHPLTAAVVPAAAASSAINSANKAPVISASAGRQTSVSNTTTVTTGDIKVESPSADPRQVAAAIPGALNDHFSNTAQHFDDGVSH